LISVRVSDAACRKAKIGKMITMQMQQGEEGRIDSQTAIEMV
jgi:hypothetical protein